MRIYNRILGAAAAALLFTAGPAPADFIIFESDLLNPYTIEVSTSDFDQNVQESFFLSTSGISTTEGDLEISISAIDASTQNGNHDRELRITLITDSFSVADYGDVLSEGQTVTWGSTDLLLMSGRGISETTNGYVGLRLDAGAGNYYYGWAQYVATGTIEQSAKDSNLSLTINKMVYNDNVNEGIMIGTQTIPEPAVATLIAGFGIAVLSIKRIFMD